MSNVVSIKPIEYMDAVKLRAFRELLTKMLKETVTTIHEAATVPVDNEKHADDNDIASMRENANMEMHRRERDNHLLKKIEKAINRIDKKEYGYCEECGEEIGEARLRARPTANLCITCKELTEKTEKQYTKQRANA